MSEKLPDTINELLVRIPQPRHDDVLDIMTLEDGTKQVVHSVKVVAPERKESPRRSHVFNSTAAFCAYLAAYGCETSLITVGANGTAKAVLNEDAGKGLEVIYYEPKYSAQFAAWSDKFSRLGDMRDFRNFFAERSSEIAYATVEQVSKVGGKDVHSFEKIDARSLRRVLSNIVASTTQKVFSGVGADALNGVVLQTKIRGADGPESTVNLPESIAVKIPLYVDDEPGELQFDLDVQAISDDKAGMRMTFGQLESIKAKRTEKLLKAVQEVAVQLECICGYGNIAHAEWDYIR